MRAPSRIAGFLWVSAALACSSCGSSDSAPRSVDRGPESRSGAPGVDGDFPDASAVVGPPPPDAAEPFGPPTPGPSAEPAAVAPAPPTPATEPSAVTPDTDPLWRADGRPTWWLSAPVRESGRIMLTAEAIAPDILAARRASISAARAALRALSARDIEGERVEAAVVRRLPGDAPGRDRFVGYARISAIDPTP